MAPAAVPQDLKCPMCTQVLRNRVAGNGCQSPHCRLEKLEKTLAEKDAKIAVIEARLAEVVHKTAGPGSGLDSPDDGSTCSTTSAGSSSARTSGSWSGSRVTTRPWEATCVEAVVADVVSSPMPEARGVLVHASTMVSCGSRFYESLETTLNGVLRWCLWVTPEKPPCGFIKVGVAADGARQGSYLAALGTLDSPVSLWGQYIEVVADMANGRVVFAVGETRHSMTEVTSHEVPTDRAVRLTCKTGLLCFPNPGATGADAVFEFR